MYFLWLSSRIFFIFGNMQFDYEVTEVSFFEFTLFWMSVLLWIYTFVYFTSEGALSAIIF